MKLGLSTAAFYGRYETEDAAARIAQLPLDCAEVFLQSDSENTVDFARLVKKNLSGMPCTSIHPLGGYENYMAGRPARQVRDAFDHFRRVLDAGQALGAGVFVYHGRNTPLLKPVPWNLAWNIEAIVPMCEETEKRGMVIAWENVCWCQLTEPARVLEAKARQNDVLRELMQQRKELNQQQIAQKKQVKNLRQQEKNLKGKVSDQQKKLNALDKEIDRQIAYEIEQARKRAEEAARKRAAAEAARRAQKEKAAAAGKGSKGKSKSRQPVETPKPAPAPKSGSWLTPEEVQLNGNFVQNKGRLPVPITGQYMIGNRFGKYNVPGLRNVQLDNKGTNYVGKPGARARSIFDGVVSAIFQFGGNKNVLVRHGSYISVYCNLSSVIVAKGQKVRARDILGTVKEDGEGNCVLHFQLRKETAKLNPEVWIGR